MFDDLKLRPSTYAVLQYSSCVLALLLVCASFTIGAIWAFPIWDDAATWLLLKEEGVGAFAANHPDRPVWASLLSLLATSEQAFWRTAFVAQALLWPTFGVISALLWNSLFPRLRRYAFVVGCVTVAPFVTKVQMLAANIALGSLFVPLMKFGCVSHRFFLGGTGTSL